MHKTKTYERYINFFCRLWMRASIRNMLAIHVFMQIKWKIRFDRTAHKTQKLFKSTSQLCITSQYISYASYALLVGCESSSINALYIIITYVYAAVCCLLEWLYIVIEWYLKCNFVCIKRVHANSNSEIFHILWTLSIIAYIIINALHRIAVQFALISIALYVSY